MRMSLSLLEGVSLVAVKALERIKDNIVWIVRLDDTKK